jgi:LPS export ABC transporter permease LptF/LPS export ABC transporter permease LptG
MVKDFDRYLLKEMAAPFGVGLAVYTFTLIVNQVLRLSKLLIAKGASAGTVTQLLLYLLPDMLSFTVPMATLMGILAGLSRLSTDSEIIAFRTVGVPNRRILRPVMLFCACNWLLSSWLIMYLAPEANYRVNQLVTEVVLSQSIASVKPGTFCQDLPHYTLYFREVGADGQWRDVLLYSQSEPENDVLMMAKRGRFVQDRERRASFIVLDDGVIYSFKRSQPESTTLTRFSRKTEALVPYMTGERSRASTQMIFPELLRRWRKNPGDRTLAMEFHNKFALPFACLALGFLGLSLGISTRKGGKTSGFVISLGIIFFYYVMITAGRNLIMKKIVSPFLGMWAPNLFLLVAGLLLYRFAAREREIGWEKLLSLGDRFLRRRKRSADRPGRRSPRRRRPPLLPILDNYVLRRMLSLFLMVFLSLMLVFYIISIIDLMDDLIENKVPFIYNLKFNFFQTPENLTMVLPVAMLTAVLLTFSLMSKNNEVTAVQVSGISLYRLTVPAFLFGLLVSGACFFIQENWLPESSRLATQCLDVIHNRRRPDDMGGSRNWVLGRDGTIYFYSFFDSARHRFIDFNVLSRDGNGAPERRLTFRSARWQGEGFMKAEDGFIRRFRFDPALGLSVPSSVQRVHAIMLPIDQKAEDFRDRTRFSETMNIPQLRDYIRFLKERNSDPTRYEAQLYYNFAFPLSSLVMVLIAVPFSFRMGHRGTLFGIGVAVAISMLYWGVLGAFNALGTTAVLSPVLSAFAPLLLFAAVSLVLFIGVRT